MTKKFPATVAAIVFVAATICPAQAQTLAAGNALPGVGEASALSSDASTAVALRQPGSAAINPIAASVEAAAWPALERNQPAAQQPTAPPTTSSDHHKLYLTAGILGAAAFGIGLAAHNLASSNCKSSVGVCGSVESFGNVLMPVGAIGAGLGFFFAFHHAD